MNINWLTFTLHKHNCFVRNLLTSILNHDKLTTFLIGGVHIINMYVIIFCFVKLLCLFSWYWEIKIGCVYHTVSDCNNMTSPTQCVKACKLPSSSLKLRRPFGWELKPLQETETRAVAYYTALGFTMIWMTENLHHHDMNCCTLPYGKGPKIN